jgi:hypothetical protein
MPCNGNNEKGESFEMGDHYPVGMQTGMTIGGESVTSLA